MPNHQDVVPPFFASFSRTGANDLEPLLESILTHWKPLDIDFTSVILNQINATSIEDNNGGRIELNEDPPIKK